MPIDLFGFSIGRTGRQQPLLEPAEERKGKAKSFAPPDYDDGAVTVSGGGYFGSYVDFEGTIKNEVDLIYKYRDMAMHAEIEQAIEDIANDSVVYDTRRQAVEINMDDVDLPKSIKDKVKSEFDFVLRLLNFKKKGYELFRKWYIDGRLYHHIIIDESNPKKGIIELRPIDAAKIRKIRKVTKKPKPDAKTPTEMIDSVEEFFIYSDNKYNQNTVEGIKVAIDSISYINSGLYDAHNKRVLSYLHKAIKPLNQLRMIEDAVVIYRISRAPERRIFYVDVGNLPKVKAEQYLRDVMNRYRNKLVYDSNNGEIRDDKRHMSILEDFYMPRREGGRGTEISTLDGGQNLGEIEDVDYFKKKLYRSLNIPISRLEAENGFNMGRSAEITRDEVKFFDLFLNALRVQLIMKGIMTEDDWNLISPDIQFDYTKDSYFTELKENEILKERIEALQGLDDFIGKFYSIEYIRKNILKQTEEEMREIDSQIEKEKELAGDEDDDL